MSVTYKEQLPIIGKSKLPDRKIGQVFHRTISTNVQLGKKPQHY